MLFGCQVGFDFDFLLWKKIDRQLGTIEVLTANSNYQRLTKDSLVIVIAAVLIVAGDLHGETFDAFLSQLIKW